MPASPARPVGLLAADISNAMVRLLSDYTGRGPTKARTYIQDDLVTVVLRDTLTKGERSLCRDGKAELVLANRTAFQETMADDLIAVVEQLIGRKVEAFLSANHIDPDLAVESFVLTKSADSDSGDSAAA